ncbi:hypothetical protein [Listeria booriae]|uniref:hypothetical protein n=1 Tax=Listeria booriae TaxID=1552123 RepID=UPI0016256873|nr:hypothetical protein [Listeria booriae]MBC1974541.1 hypothetical protein [Listeria booriae]MBC1983473.1 hypothetical protein [Listeria booriae]MBC2031833.1 hypothetical protein [Listeria booriae]
MLNTVVNSRSNTNIKLNSVSGTLFKTHDKSFFIRFHLQSKMAGKILDPNPSMQISYKSTDCVVLQIMICGDMEVLVELVRQSDIEEAE